jgi:hypothetical protein
MPSTVRSNKLLWTGRVITAIPVLFLLFDSIIHVLNIAPVVEASVQLGYPVNIARSLGIIELVCLFAYLWPRTAILGGILLTGYLGGAIAANVRVANPLFSHVLFPAYVGLLLWAGLYLRDTRVRTLLPVR